MHSLGWILAIVIGVAAEYATPALQVPAGPPHAPQEETLITNADVIAMVRAELETATIVVAMNTLETAFDTSADALIALRDAGVPDDVIIEMLRGGAAETTRAAASMWRIGTFDRRNDDLAPSMEFPPTVRYSIDPDGSHSGHFPNAHLPQDGARNAAHTIQIAFHAAPGRYVLSVGQPRTVDPEIVAVLLDGAPVGQYTTALEYAVHEIPLLIPHPGQHTLTLDRFSGNGGYQLDALELKRINAPEPEA